MDLSEQLLVDMSLRNVDYIAHHIGNDPLLFKDLAMLIFTGIDPIPLRASWVATKVTDKYPELFKPYLNKIVSHLEKFDHPGIRRNLLRYVAEIEIPDSLEGKLYDICHNYLISRTEPPGVKVHCMQILFNIAQKEPDLKNELRLILEELVNHESAAIKSRSKHLISRL